MAAHEDGSSSRFPTGGGLPLGLAILAALFYSFSSTGPSRQTSESVKKRTESEVGSRSDSALKPLYEFLDIQSGTGDSSGPCGPSAPYTADFVIATVPDPIDSHLAPSFDRAIDAIQRGLQSKGFTLERFWIPWKHESSTKWELSLELPPAVTQGSKESVHRKKPGTLLFRDSNDPSHLFVLLLVGEVPTWGIQREAMSTALKAIEGIENPGTHHCLEVERREIRILGPYFSGSAESLRNVVDSWNKFPKRQVSMLSGSATVDSNLETLNGEKMSFHATVIPDVVLAYQFHRFLRERLGACSKDVALFVEGGTTYGSASVRFRDEKAGKGRDRPDDQYATGKESDGQQARDQSRDFRRERPRFTIEFPLHVAQLRAAYEKDAALRTPSGQTRGPRHGLELALERIPPRGQSAGRPGWPRR